MVVGKVFGGANANVLAFTNEQVHIPNGVDKIARCIGVVYMDCILEFGVGLVVVY